MLILLPPSESKADPRRGRPLDLATLSFPALGDTRERVVDALLDLCTGDLERARNALGLTPGQAEDLARNALIRTSPAAPAGRIYTGVLYDALDLATLSAAAKRRAATRLAVASALFGLVRVGDRISSYRLSGASMMPGLGTLASVWRQPLGTVLTEEARRGLLVDLRSGTYAGFWRPRPRAGVNLVSVRVLQESAGIRTVVSHFNKATKGRMVRALLEDGANPTSARGLATVLTRLGWHVEPDPSNARALDVVVTEI